MPTSGAPQPVGNCRRHTTLFVLFVLNLLNYMDRYVVSGIMPILVDKRHPPFAEVMSTTQGGFLTTAFVIVYMVTAPVFGYYGDRVSSRKTLIVVGCILWALASVYGSFAKNYSQLLISRAAVGIGEASYNTVAPVIIADMYGPEQRTSYLALFYIAIPVGSALGYGVGSIVGNGAGWQWALRITPPIVACMALLVVPFTYEPERGESDRDSNSDSKPSMTAEGGVRGLLRSVCVVLRIPSFTLSTLAAAAAYFSVGALAAWIPTFITAVRGGADAVKASHQLDPGVLFGGVTVSAGLLGTVLGSQLAQRLSVTFGARNSIWGAESFVCGVAMLVATPPVLAGIAAASHSETAMWALIFIGELLLCMFWAPLTGISMLVIQPQFRAIGQAVQLLVGHLFGDAASATIVGLIAERLMGCAACGTDTNAPNATLADAVPTWLGNGTLAPTAAPSAMPSCGGCPHVVHAWQTALLCCCGPTQIISGVLFLFASRGRQNRDNERMKQAMLLAASPGPSSVFYSAADDATVPLLAGEAELSPTTDARLSVNFHRDPAAGRPVSANRYQEIGSW